MFTLDEIQAFTRVEVQQLFEVFSDSDPISLSFSKIELPDGIAKSAFTKQLAIRQKAKLKWPSWAWVKGLVFPDELVCQQASSPAVAMARFDGLSGQTAADLTAGLGVDALALAQKFNTVLIAESEPIRLACLKNNLLALKNILNTQFGFYSSAEALVHELTEIDFIYLDPDRRPNANKRVYTMTDSVPNFLQLKEELISKSERVMVKLSPMLSPKQILNDIGFGGVSVIEQSGECKEVVFNSQPENDAIKLLTINSISVSNYLISKIDDNIVYAEDIETYLYIAGAGLNRTELADDYAHHLGLKRLAGAIGVFTYTALIDGWPGRILQVLHTSNKLSKGAIDYFDKNKASIICRLPKIDSETLRKKYKIGEHDVNYMVAIRHQQQNVYLFCSLIK